ncbi:N-6 DNA methylase [Thermococcus sp. SY098]|uniref:Eco57I restriction-modification methylase domain-containing protein n=1 Tax=Thermococcus sp. SY098 TaxID=3111325 RepID=UPI002D772965|nr:N-6 DNA methylase [Thermococcus sp. SY098]WRS51868.1 N-6 DNA methylase [Thermococcus sp. SY098]
MSPKVKNEFPDMVFNVFKKIYTKSIGKSEFHTRDLLKRYFLEDLLGYSEKDIEWEKKKADLTVFDENRFPVIKIETKRIGHRLRQNDMEQALKYREPGTRYIILTNIERLLLWDVSVGKRLVLDFDFGNVFEREKHKTFEETLLTSKEKIDLYKLAELKKDVIFSPEKYIAFSKDYAKIDISTEEGFNELIEKLKFIVNEILYPYAANAFEEYREKFREYKKKREELEKALKHNPEAINDLMKLEAEYERYKLFSGYELWKKHLGKEEENEELKDVFIRESIYVLLNKLLFIRICEDKGLLPKNISNGGIEELRKHVADPNSAYNQIMSWAFENAKYLYSHFYETGILDWLSSGDGDLNRRLNRVLWILNRFDFSKVDRDILGNLYEKYLDPKERKRLGEFYTPVEIIDYILDGVGYKVGEDIEDKKILDPACGSGGFLVRATRRLIARFLVKLGKATEEELEKVEWKFLINRLSPEEAKEILEAVRENVYGLDINPFACHIAEMNMLFQVIDLYQKAREKYESYRLRRFNIYMTDSLRTPKEGDLTAFIGKYSFLDEKKRVDNIKKMKFDFVVGNPPYVRVQNLDEDTREFLRRAYKTVSGKFDIYIPFIERGLRWLKDNGKLGYIVPNTFMTRQYGAGIREYLLNFRIVHILDFGDSKVFEDATNYPAIIIVEKSPPSENWEIMAGEVFKGRKEIEAKFGSRRRFLEEVKAHLGDSLYEDPEGFFRVFLQRQDTLSREPWSLVPDRVRDIMRKIEKDSVKLGDIIETMYEGFISGANDVYLITKEKAKELNLEEELLKPVPKGAEIKRWGFKVSRYVIYPHHDDGSPIGEDELIGEKRFRDTNVYRYLKEHEAKLKKREYMMNAIKKGQRKYWYELWNPRSSKMFEPPKLITPNLSKESRFALDTDGVFLDHDSYGIKLKKKALKEFPYPYLLALLNSRVLEFYLKQISPYASGKYYRYTNEYLSRLPLRKADKRTIRAIAKIVLKLMKLVESLNPDFEAITQGIPLLRKPGVQFHIKDKVRLDLLGIKDDEIKFNGGSIRIKDDILREYVFLYLLWLKKEGKSELRREELTKIPVPENIKEAVDRMAILKEDERNKRLRRIADLEDKLNEIIYELYGLSEEERKIIEMEIWRAVS